jgi:hypothetical protein
MALDQASNWEIQMADNLAKVKLDFHKNKSKDVENTNGNSRQADNVGASRAWIGEPIYLPDEVVLQILEYVAHDHDAQRTLASVCLLSRQWHNAGVSYLYRYPDLYGPNFDKFYNAICPSKNLHIRYSRLSKMVKVLDMSRLVHQSSRSTTARMLGRTKDSHFASSGKVPEPSFVGLVPSLRVSSSSSPISHGIASQEPGNLPASEVFRFWSASQW